MGAPLLLALAAVLFADCGGEVWTLPAVELHSEVRRNAVGSFAVQLASGAAEEVRTFRKTPLGFYPDDILLPDDFAPVSRAPDCGARHPLSGYKLPLLEREEGFSRVIYDARTGAEAWLHDSEVNAHSVLFDSLPAGSHLMRFPDFHAKGEYGIHLDTSAAPSAPLQEEGIRIYGREGNFLRLERREWNHETNSWDAFLLGWTPLRSKDGRLLYWPWYYDDC